MLKDIQLEPVENVGVAIVPEQNKENETVYNVYLINLKEEAISGVLVSSKGYGELKGEKRNTSVLRHFLDTLPPHSAKLIEPIVPDVFDLTNEYWLSFYLDQKMQDKKFLFVPESIKPENFVQVPIIEKKGVIIL